VPEPTALRQLLYTASKIESATKNQEQEAKNISAFEHTQYAVTNENNKAQYEQTKG
jgi:hypothetical protein